jgi:hypothetical protein
MVERGTQLDQRAPVMADHRERLVAELIRDRHDVGPPSPASNTRSTVASSAAMADQELGPVNGRR